MDTTTVNFAINKMSEGWSKVAPTIQDIGEKYVQYVVMKEIVLAGIAILIFLMGLIFLITGLIKSRKIQKSEWSEGSINTVFTIIFLVLGCVGFLLGGFATLNQGYYAALAYLNPEMYTIQTIIDAAKTR